MMTGCSYNPRETKASEGMHRCPECGCPCIAGMPHPITQEYAPVEATNYEQPRMR